MPATTGSSTALPIVHITLRVLIVLNVLMVPAILALLFLVPTREWIMTSLSLSPSPAAEKLIQGLYMIAFIGIFSVPLNHVVLSRLLAMVETVRSGDPFIVANATRLRTIAFMLLSLQCLGLAVDQIVKSVEIPGHPLQIDGGSSISGWLAVLLTFLLARVFEEGARMREDLAGTV